MYNINKYIYLLGHVSFKEVFQQPRITVYVIDSAQFIKLEFFSLSDFV